MRLLRRGGGYTDQRHLAIDDTEEVDADVLDRYAASAHREQESQRKSSERLLAAELKVILDEIEAVKTAVATQHSPNRTAHLRDLNNARRSLTKLHLSLTDTPIH